MTTHSDLLVHVKTRHKDAAWLTENEGVLLKAIYHELKRNGNHDAGISGLLYLLPQFVHSPHVKRWHKLNIKALKVAHRRSHFDLSTNTVRAMYVFPLQTPKSVRLRRTRSDRITSIEVFDAYTRLWMEKFFVYPQAVTSELFTQLTYMARIVNMPYYYHKVYQILGLICNYHEDYKKALDWLLMAYPHWQAVDDVPELAITAYAMGVAYQGLGQYAQAESWLLHAVTLFGELDMPQPLEAAKDALATFQVKTP